MTIPARLSFSGRIVTGRGEAGGFTRLDWVRDQLIDIVGIDPYPGTLNLIVDTDEGLEGWRALRSRQGMAISPPSADWCRACCYAVRLADRVPAAIVLPEVAEYPPAQVEVIAALPLRQQLDRGEGDEIVVGASEPLPVRAVIFDVDGTLVDSLGAFRVVAELTAAPYGFAVTDADVRHALTTGRPFWEIVMPPHVERRAELRKTLEREAFRRWPDVLREHGKVPDEAGPLLAALRDRGARLGIVTGSGRASLEPLRAGGLLDLFDAVITSQDVRRPKPDPEGLLTCADRLGVDPREAVYIGDTPLDVRASRAAGMFAIGFVAGAGDSALLSGTGPDHLAASHARVLDVLDVRAHPTACRRRSR